MNEMAGGRLNVKLVRFLKVKDPPDSGNTRLQRGGIKRQYAMLHNDTYTRRNGRRRGKKDRQSKKKTLKQMHLKSLPSITVMNRNIIIIIIIAIVINLIVRRDMLVCLPCHHHNHCMTKRATGTVSNK